MVDILNIEHEISREKESAFSTKFKGNTLHSIVIQCILQCSLTACFLRVMTILKQKPHTYKLKNNKALVPSTRIRSLKQPKT